MGQPVVTAHLEAVWDGVDLGDFLVGQTPVVKSEVGLDARRRDALGQNTPSLLDAPEQKNLRGALALGFGNLFKGAVVGKRRVRAPERGITG